MKRLPISLLFLFLSSSAVFAEDLGIIGPVYEIAERDLIEVIQDRLRAMEANGELDAMQDEYREKVIAGIERPRPVPGVVHAESSLTNFIDPTYTLDRDVVDEQGRVIFERGMKINPLDYAGLNKVLVFFDGDNEEQKAFVLRLVEDEALPVKPILVAGAPLELMREWQREVFFDQGGTLARYFKINGSPAVVRQEGKRLRVDEIRL